MKLTRLASIFELKYSLKAEAAIQDVINDIKRDIINAYKLYVDAKTAKEPALQIFAEAGEPNAAKIIAYMTAMVAKINELGAKPSHLFKAVNKVLEYTTALDKFMKTEGFNPERLPNEATRNQLNHYKRTLGTVLQRLSYILVKQAKILQKFLPQDVPLSGEEIIPDRKPISKDKLRMYGAVLFGSDNLDIMSKLLEDPEMRERITTLINSIERGNLSARDVKVMEEARHIKNWLAEKTNVSALDKSPPAKLEPGNLFEEKGYNTLENEE